MKKIVLSSLFIIAIQVNAQTNIYHPFPDSAANWNFSYFFACLISPTTAQEFSIEISGDTTIGTTVYHKLNTPFIQDVLIGTCAGTSGGYQGAYRNDTANRKVYFVMPADSIEQLLYDFNMQVGDTVKGILQSMTITPDTVQAIDSVLVGSDYRKRWVINPCYDIYLIEGIGSTFGLVKSSFGCLTDGYNYYLTCFRQDGVTLYPTTITNCPLINGTDKIPDKLKTISLTPNPFHLSSKLKINSNFENSTMIIYNSLGKVVREEKIKNKNEIIINRDQLSNGFYYLQLQNETGLITTEKFIVY